MMVRDEWLRTHRPQPDNFQTITRRRLEWWAEELRRRELRERANVRKNWPVFRARPLPAYIRRRKAELARGKMGDTGN